MSTRKHEVPKGASILAQYSTTLTQDTNKTRYPGATVTVTLWGGYASQGYKTNYTAVPHRWLVVEIVSATPFEDPHRFHGRYTQRTDYAWQYSGKRINQAEENYRRWMNDLGGFSAAMDAAPADYSDMMYAAMDAAQFGY